MKVNDTPLMHRVSTMSNMKRVGTFGGGEMLRTRELEERVAWLERQLVKHQQATARAKQKADRMTRAAVHAAGGHGSKNARSGILGFRHEPMQQVIANDD